MRHETLICIDFGSAYTKVAIRPAWDGNAELTRDTSLAAEETTFCIPSVVAKVERKGGTKWIVGQAAAQQIAGDGVTIYEHFKAKLLSDQSSARDIDEHHKIGVVFFKQLRAALEKVSLTAKLDDCPARLCIPRLEHNGRTEERMTAVLSEAGWGLASRATIFEPESNAIGVFTRGQNATHFPSRHGLQSAERHPYFLKMFDKNGLLRAIRNVNVAHYGALVVDIGAFTTDFGYVKFDATLEKAPQIVQLSSEIGVRQLDDLVRSQLPSQGRNAIKTVPTSFWETAKRLLYNGEAAAVPDPKGGMLELGKGDEGTAIVLAMHQFADRIVQAEQQFRRTQVTGPVDAYVLTGGGALIPTVRHVLVRAAKKSGVKLIYDLQDENEPKQVLLQKRDESGWYYDPKELEERLLHNRELMRGGSAIGGCSVFFESSPVAQTA